MIESKLFLVVLVLVLLGLLASGLYYFFRFYFKEKTFDSKPHSLEEALNCTREHFFGRVKKVFSGSFKFSSVELDELEEILYTSDLGVKTVERIVESLRFKNSEVPFCNFNELKESLRHYMLEAFQKSERDLLFPKKGSTTFVWMIVGVNGVGKTTTIGKLAFQACQKGLKTLVIAGDRFRSAAESQLEVWTKRAHAELFNPLGVKDPSAVIFDGCQRAKKISYDLVIVDTAGRLHTQEPLIRELEKSKRVIQKVFKNAPEEILQVLDANSGQNALVQTQKFHEILDLTGVILTKLDGSAKGGVALGLESEYKLPIKAIGIGEKIEDLSAFHPLEFVYSILS